MSEWNDVSTETTLRHEDECLPVFMTTAAFYIPDTPADAPPHTARHTAQQIDSQPGFYEVRSYTDRVRPHSAERPDVNAGAYIDQPVSPWLPNRYTYIEARRKLESFEQDKIKRGWKKAPSSPRDARDHYTNYSVQAKPCDERQRAQPEPLVA